VIVIGFVDMWIIRIYLFNSYYYALFSCG